MFYTNIQSPRIQLWQNRLARVPRWGWVALFIGVVLPVVILGVGILVLALLSGVLFFVAAAAAMMVVRLIRGISHRQRDDGRRNVRIVVHSARVIDP